MMAFRGVRSSCDMFARKCGLVLAGDLQRLAGLLDLLEEARVLDRQDRLAGERLDQVHDRLGELAGRLAADHQHADDALLADQRDGQVGAEPGLDQHAERSREPEAGLSQQVRRLDGGAAARGPTDRGVVLKPRAAGVAEGSDHLVGHAVGSSVDEVAGCLVELEDRAAIGRGEAGGVRHDGRQHLLVIERRGDGLADLGEGALLLDGARELGRALLQLLEQPRVLDRDDGLVSERLQERDLLVG